MLHKMKCYKYWAVFYCCKIVKTVGHIPTRQFVLNRQSIWHFLKRLVTTIFTLADFAKIPPKNFFFQKMAIRLYKVRKKDYTQSAYFHLLKIYFFGESLQCLQVWKIDVNKLLWKYIYKMIDFDLQSIFFKTFCLVGIPWNPFKVPQVHDQLMGCPMAWQALLYFLLKCHQTCWYRPILYPSIYSWDHFHKINLQVWLND
jgi:hypothetical protein